MQTNARDSVSLDLVPSELGLELPSVEASSRACSQWRPGQLAVFQSLIGFDAGEIQAYSAE